MVLSAVVPLLASGCGTSAGATNLGSLLVSDTALAFGSVPVGQTGSATVTLSNSGTAPIVIPQMSISGQSFSLNTQSSAPVVLAGGASYTLQVHFAPAAPGAATGILTLTSNASKASTATVSLSGTGVATATKAATLSSLTCSRSSATGAGSDACTLALSAAAPSGGVTAALASSDAAVSIPGSVTVPEGAASVGFTATIAAVNSAQRATLTATEGGASESYALDLSPVSASTTTPALTLSTSSLNFGSVLVNATSAAQAVTLTSSGTAAVTISAATLSGSGFSMSGMSFPATLNPGRTATLKITFDPAAVRTMTGTLTISSDAAGAAVVSLQGTGTTAAGVLSGISCSSASITGARNDLCSVALTSAAGSGGVAVSLASSNKAVTVPSAVTVPAGSTSAAFTATAAAVTSTQPAILTAAAGGITKTYTLQLNGGTAALTLSTESLNFGSVVVNTTSAAQSVTLTSSGTAPVTISGATLSGSGFSMSGTAFPGTLNPGQTATLAIKFDPATAKAVTGTVTISSDAAAGGTAVVSLSGTGTATAGVLSGLSCSSGALTGAGSDACTVTLSGAAGSGGLAVSLASSSKSVTVPAGITVPAGTSSTSFTATVAAVTSTQTATLTATAGGVSKTYALQLSTGSPALTVGAATVAFGDVTLSTPATQSVALTSSGTAPLTINSATIAGSGFTFAGANFPTTLNPGKAVTLQVQFDPKAAGAVTGSLTITSNASAAPTVKVTLSGTGEAGAGHSVDLSWDAPGSSADPVAGYDIYRAPSGSSEYVLLNSSINTSTSYTDSTVQSGTSYNYIVESVDASGVESTPSNVFAATIP